ncbi:HD domain-containing phosphohydrolase [Fusibacter sp. 3D3]|uniref:HD domain-containing phosphohydrolase n=1 Tax=Fusibacter sp. 3D3 TaxID=1048380 RepID=UPI00085361A4|nr:HD domain-containing phosphohydrolase [Fusibacter sp. 3D3]GAU79638.1 diguanylate cyclase/phosphodiesterase [Fusibacter sp. 3D3]
MNRIIRGIHFIYALLLLLVLVVVNLQFKDAGIVLAEEVKRNAMLSVDIMDYQVNEWVAENAKVISTAKDYIEIHLEDSELILEMLKDKLNKHDLFMSLYYGSSENELINASLFTPPPEFDLRMRPWYLEAVMAGKLIITDPFLNATKDAWIVTIAVPVYDSDRALEGVVAGDISLVKLESVLDNSEKFGPGITYLLSSKGEKMVELDQLDHEASSVNAYELMKQWYALRDDQATSYGMLEEQIGNLKGYFHYHEFSEFGWTLISFAPINNYSDSLIRLQFFSIALSIAIIGTFIVLILILRAVIAKPLFEFEEQVANIDLDREVDQQIVLSSNQALGKLSDKINTMLNQFFKQVKTLNDDKDELMALNEELEATYSQLVATEQEVTRQKQNFEALFRNAQDAIVMFDQNHQILEINDAFEKLFGYSIYEISGQNLDVVLSDESYRKEAEKLTQKVFGGEMVRFESIRYGKHMTPHQVSIQGVPMTYQGVMIGGYGVYTDISERKRREANLAYISTHDDLTTLFNRAYFEKKISDLKTIEHLPLGIIMMDVNGLKLINDAFGHRAGDHLLNEIATQVKKICRRGEIVARMGGDEFAVLVTKSTHEILERLTDEILVCCNQIKVNEVSISVSLGHAQLVTLEDKIADVFKTAEDYLNKRKLTEGPSVRGKAIYAIVNTLHEKNKREEQHSKRVSELSYELGRALKLSDRETNELKTIGLLHDVGKIAIDEKILNKEGHLTPEEYSEMQKHPEIGYRILSTVNEMSEIAEHVLAHHESYDGKGYPKGLKGEEIPYLARIITVADAFDAMTSDRTYRKAMTYEEAYEELRRVAGIQFDPSIVETFIEYLESTRNEGTKEHHYG